MRRPHIWTVREIQQLPEFGKHGWFYGLVRDDGLHLAEIVPGMGWTKPFWPLSPRRVILDIFRYRPSPPRVSTNTTIPFNTASTNSTTYRSSASIPPTEREGTD